MSSVETRYLMRLLLIAVGYRDDLDLSARWWHRLAKVVAIIAISVLGLLIPLVLSSLPHQPSANEIHVLTTLQEATAAAAPSTVNTIPGFLDRPGNLGAFKDSEVLFVSSYSLGKGVCSPDLAANAAEVAQELDRHFGGEAIYRAADILGFAGRSNTRIYCLYNRTDLPFSPAEIIKYENTWVFYVHRYGLILLQTLILQAMLACVALNSYYRGFVYIIFGRRISVPTLQQANNTLAPAELYRFCPHCGKQNSDGQFCANCGTALRAASRVSHTRASILPPIAHQLSSRFLGSTLALVIGALGWIGGLAEGAAATPGQVRGPNSDQGVTGFFILLGAFAYRSAKQRKLGLKRDTALRIMGEATLILLMLPAVLVSWYEHPLWLVTLIWTVISYAAVVYPRQSHFMAMSR